MSARKSRAEAMDFRVEHVDTPLGCMLIVTDARGALRALDWDDHETRMQRLLQRYHPGSAIALVPALRESPARRALSAYFAGNSNAVADLATASFGTPFQREVWAALRRIPPGQTSSYGALAARIGRPAAVRAVGLANGANPIAIVVPCHRVVGADASLTGYGSGIERKRWLLDHESANRLLERRSLLPTTT